DRDSTLPTIRSRKQRLRSDTPNLQAVPNPRDPARDTASVRVLTASFEKMRLTCDFTVSGEISRVRAMRLLVKPWLIIARTLRSRAVSLSLTRLLGCSGGLPA